MGRVVTNAERAIRSQLDREAVRTYEERTDARVRVSGECNSTEHETVAYAMRVVLALGKPAYVSVY